MQNECYKNHRFSQLEGSAYNYELNDIPFNFYIIYFYIFFPGIHVLRIVKYDRQTLALRRHQSENIDSDPIVWTNQRFVRWAKSINLGEYADNLKGIYYYFIYNKL